MCKFEKQNCLEDSCHSLTLSLLIGLEMTCRGILPPPHHHPQDLSHSHPGRSRVDSRHTLIRGGAMSTYVTLSSREEPCRLTLSSGEEPCRLTLSSREEPC